ncbi:hypothetical protein D3Y57_19265 [Sphingomonas paeninsulae]|uniref:Uncharacterized protein n=2 Tax=Sphingomonas paeninsulae TaxID=2319844 RepID=A0A494TJI6_SPHPE|nr:hypothetical protein D3Y57_19265 [Sphingomonas paeninsulae]
MVTALQANPTTLFGALQIDLKSGQTVRVLDGCASLTFNGGTFTGLDPLFGTIAAIDTIEDGFGDEAPALSFNFIPASGASIAALAVPANQGSRVRVWLGALDTSYNVVADPILLFDGELDQITPTVGKDKRELDVDAVSGMERFFDNQEGVRLSPTFHKSLWPGETGLDNITGLENKVFWGVMGESVSPVTIGYVGGPSGGSGRGNSGAVQW